MKIMITTGQGPKECQFFLDKGVGRLLDRSKQAGVKVEVLEKTQGRVVLDVADRAWARQWLGSWQWKCRSPFRKNHKRARWFLEAKSMEEESCDFVLNEKDVEFQAMRAGGPGGQHQNKRESAVRATWRSPSGEEFVAVSRMQRSQHQNKALAIKMLREKIEHQTNRVAKHQAGVIHVSSKQITRGDASVFFEGEDVQLVEL
jgi:peptide chain release factor